MTHIYRLLFVIGILSVACGDEKAPGDNEANTTTGGTQPAVIGYQLMQTFPHDTGAFTEGMQYVNGKILESTGEYGQSDIRYTDLTPVKCWQW